MSVLPDLPRFVPNVRFGPKCPFCPLSLSVTGICCGRQQLAGVCCERQQTPANELLSQGREIAITITFVQRVLRFTVRSVSGELGPRAFPILRDHFQNPANGVEIATVCPTQTVGTLQFRNGRNEFPYPRFPILGNSGGDSRIGATNKRHCFPLSREGLGEARRPPLASVTPCTCRRACRPLRALCARSR